MKIGRELASGIVGSLPSLFDVLVCSYLLFISFWPNNYETRIAFNLGIIGMLSFTLALKPLRGFKSLPLALIVLWTFISIFLHSYKPDYAQDTIVYKYLNVFVLSEGFIYVFSGAFLLYLVIRYSKSLWLYIGTLGICLIPYFKSAYTHGKMTPVVSFLLALLIYSIINKRWFWAKISVSLMGLGASALWLKWFLTVQQEAKNVIYFKFACRPYIWVQLWRNLKDHWVLGTGFPHYLGVSNMFWVGKIGKVEQGWLFRHNDYLGIGVYLGTLIILLILWFLVEQVVKIRSRLSVIGLLTLAIMPIFQCTMFNVYNASICLTIAGLCIRSGINGKS